MVYGNCKALLVLLLAVGLAGLSFPAVAAAQAPSYRADPTAAPIGHHHGPAVSYLTSPPSESKAAPPIRFNGAPIRDSQRNFQAFAKDSRTLRTENVILQQRDFSCGAAALATIVKHFWGENVNETQILVGILSTLSREDLQERIANGLTLTDLKRVSEKAGYVAVLGKLEIDGLRESKVPLLVGITVNGFDHFVVVRGLDDQYVYLADPAVGKIRVAIPDFEKQWQQNTVLAVIRPGVKPPTDSTLRVSVEEQTVGAANDQFIRNTLYSNIF
jgi:predicted double-glycine peptidase